MCTRTAYHPKRRPPRRRAGTPTRSPATRPSKPPHSARNLSARARTTASRAHARRSPPWGNGMGCATDTGLAPQVRARRRAGDRQVRRARSHAQAVAAAALLPRPGCRQRLLSRVCPPQVPVAELSARGLWRARGRRCETTRSASSGSGCEDSPRRPGCRAARVPHEPRNPPGRGPAQARPRPRRAPWTLPPATCSAARAASSDSASS